jgi:catechol 2,3-dioxygenase-like lactoylglutathione lyase family enzyme
MLRLHHVTIIIPPGSTDRAIGFYVGVLGLSRIEKLAPGKTGAWLDVDGRTQVHLSERPEPGHPDSHFALVVDELDRLLERLAAAGAPWHEQEDLFGGRRGFTRDPAGNRVELLARTPALDRPLMGQERD